MESDEHARRSQDRCSFEWCGNAAGLRPGQPEKTGRFRKTLDRETEEQDARILLQRRIHPCHP